MDKGPNGTIKKYFARKNNDFMTKVLTFSMDGDRDSDDSNYHSGEINTRLVANPEGAGKLRPGNTGFPASSREMSSDPASRGRLAYIGNCYSPYGVYRDPRTTFRWNSVLSVGQSW